MHPLVAEHLGEIQLLSEKYGVEKLEVFGSAMTDDFDPERSDVDFIVHYPVGYDYGPFGARLFDFEAELSRILDRPVQVVMTKALQNPLFRETAALTRMVIYGSTESHQVSARNFEYVTTTPSRAVTTPRFITSHGIGRRTTAAQWFSSRTSARSAALPTAKP